jgi:hypothetical protein
MRDFKHEDAFPDSPFMRALPPLRIPGGWTIAWNTLALDWKREDGGLGGSSLFYAVNEGRRFIIDVMFRPEFDPDGNFILEVSYRPWPRTEKGRRRKGVPFHPGGIDDEVVHRFETRSIREMPGQLQHWIARCSVWVIEGN